MISRRRLGLVAGGTLLTISAWAVQPPRPRRRLTVLVGAREDAPGSRAARDFVGFLEPRLPAYSVELAYMPGQGQATMLNALAKAEPSGTVVGWVNTPTLAARAIDRGDASLVSRIQLLGQVEREPVAFVALPGDTALTVQDVVRRASEDADAAPFATPPAGSPPHLAALRLQVLAQTQLNIVTFPSAAAALQAVLAGNTSAAALGLSAAIGPVRDGRLSAIGIAAHKRFGLLPDAPVLDEAGIPLSAFIRRGIGVPAGCPADFVATLVAAMRAAATDERFGALAAGNGYYAAWNEGAAWAARTRGEAADLGKLWETNPWKSSSGG